MIYDSHFAFHLDNSLLVAITSSLIILGKPYWAEIPLAHFGPTTTTSNRVTPSNSISSLSCHAEAASHPLGPVVPCDNGSEKKQLISSQYSW